MRAKQSLALLALLAAIAPVTPGSAEEIQKAAQQAPPINKAYLVILGNKETGFEVVPMSDLEQCEEQGAKWLSSTRINLSPLWRGFECLESHQ